MKWLGAVAVGILVGGSLVGVADAAKNVIQLSADVAAPARPFEVFSGTATIDPANTVTLASKGFKAHWKFEVTCPAREHYQLTARLWELNPPSIPQLFGDDNGIKATGTASGTCTGKTQSIPVTLQVQVTNWLVCHAEGDDLVCESGSAFVPFTVEDPSHYYLDAQFSGPSFEIGLCRHPACA